jgi:RimJ/RimL family protein N-acetyltransferase
MLIGKRVILEEIDPDNIDQLRRWRNDPDMRKYYREFKDISKDKQQAWYDERGNNSNPNHIYFQIMERTQTDLFGLERELIGCCGLHYIDWRLRSAEFGIFLGKSQGKGLGKAALTLMFDYGFRECNLHKIWAEVYEFNDAFGLYKDGMGMHEDGKIRHSQFHDGKYHDSIVLSVLEDEWFKAQGGR